MKVKQEKSHYLFDNKALMALILPLIIEQFLAVLVGMADSIMIASVGEAAVSGVSLVDQVMLLIINLFGALATGGAVVAGQYLGRKNPEEADKAANQLIWFVTILAVGVMGLVYLGKNMILQGVFGQIEPDVMEYANTYLLIVTASVPFIALYNGGAAIFRTMGNSKITMTVSLIMNAINVVGNAILIYGFHCGVEGVAIPTLVSRMTAAILITVLLSNEKQVLHLQKTLRYRPEKETIKKILKIGIPNGLENSMFQLGKVLVLSLVSTFGTYAIAANAVCNVLASFQILPGMALSLAVTTVISRCVGAKDYEQVSYYTKKLLAISYISMFVTTIVICVALPFILDVYNLSPETAKVAEEIMIFHSVSCVLIWTPAFTLPSTLRAAGDAKTCMLISIPCMWIFRIGFSYILGKYFGMGVFGVWVAMVIDWVVRVIFFVLRYCRGKWKTIRTI